MNLHLRDPDLSAHSVIAARVVLGLRVPVLGLPSGTLGGGVCSAPAEVPSRGSGTGANVRMSPESPFSTKRLIVDVIRFQPGETLTEILETPATSEQVKFGGLSCTIIRWTGAPVVAM